MIRTTDSVDRDTRGLNVYYQRIKPPINKTIGETYKREDANILRWLLPSHFQDGGPTTYHNKIQQMYTITRAQN